MARKRSSSRQRNRTRTRHLTLPLAAIAGFAPLVVSTLNTWRDSGRTAGVRHLGAALTGYDYLSKDWKVARLADGTLPILIGLMFHRIMSMLGANRMLSRAGVPYIRI